MTMLVSRPLSFPETPFVPVQTRQEILADLTTTRIVSSCAKVLLVIFDPNRRPSLSSRENAVSFLDNLDTVCDDQIQNLEHKLKYCNRL